MGCSSSKDTKQSKEDEAKRKATEAAATQQREKEFIQQQTTYKNSEATARAQILSDMETSKTTLSKQRDAEVLAIQREAALRVAARSAPVVAQSQTTTSSQERHLQVGGSVSESETIVMERSAQSESEESQLSKSAKRQENDSVDKKRRVLAQLESLSTTQKNEDEEVRSHPNSAVIDEESIKAANPSQTASKAPELLKNAADQCNDVETSHRERISHLHGTQLESLFVQFHEAIAIAELRDKHHHHGLSRSSSVSSRNAHNQRSVSRRSGSDSQLLHRLMAPLKGKSGALHCIPEEVERMGKMDVHRRVLEEIRQCRQANRRASAVFLSTSVREIFRVKDAADGGNERSTSNIGSRSCSAEAVAYRDHHILGNNTKENSIPPSARSASACSRGCSSARDASQATNSFQRSHSVGSAWARDSSQRWNYLEDNLCVPRYRPRDHVDYTPGPGAYSGPILKRR